MNGEALQQFPQTQNRGHRAHGSLRLFAAAFLCRASEPLTPHVEALVRDAANEAARLVAGGRADLARRDALAFRLLYRALRERAASVAPGEIGDGPRWQRVVHALSWLRHRQRALLILASMTPLSVADAAEVIGVGQPEAARIVVSAVARVARALGGPVDVQRDLRVAARTLGESAAEIAPPPTPPRVPRPVVRRLLGAPRVPAPPSFVTDPSPIDALLVQAENEPPDIVPAAPNPPKPPVPLPFERARRSKRSSLTTLAAAAALMVLIAFAPTGSSAFHRAPAPPTVVEGVFVTRHAPVVIPASVVARTVRVRAGDSLWAIAGKAFGDPRRWPEIWRLNKGSHMRGGERFNDPGLIRPGWVLRIPR